MGPAVNSPKKIRELIEAGMNIARLNFSHGSYEQHAQTIQYLKDAREELGKPLMILLDTKGPEIRIGKLFGGKVSLEEGQKLRLIGCAIAKSADTVPICPNQVLKNIQPGTQVLFHDGYISCRALEVRDNEVIVEVENGGDIESGKGVNIPDADLDLPPMTERDIEDICFGCKQDIDAVAASFIRSADHVLTIKKLLKKEGKPETLLFAKIENAQGVQNFDRILQVADGIMIARGDLGVEVPLSHVPSLQKMMIRKCYLVGKPSITATQMLESMIGCPRPTRAEASDVANAIYDSTSAVMLSGETAVGNYPVTTVKTMRSIIEEAEKDFDYRDFFTRHNLQVYRDIPSSVTLATVKTAYSSNAKVICAFTKGGNTARLLSRLRPGLPIMALTPEKKSFHQMAINWGVFPILDTEGCQTIEDAYQTVCKYALGHDFVQFGDIAVVTAGAPFGVSGTTNMMMVESVGDVLVRAHAGYGKNVFGKVAFIMSPEERNPYEVKDSILVIPKCDDSYLPFLKEAKGVVLENPIDDCESEQYVRVVSKTLDIPSLIRADGAFNRLYEEQLVTLDSEQALLFNGVVTDAH
jgi:pyruvate kinase